MHHVYIEGSEHETTKEYAESQIEAGNWEVCDCQHRFSKTYDSEVTVYHHAPQHRGHIPTLASA